MVDLGLESDALRHFGDGPLADLGERHLCCELHSLVHDVPHKPNTALREEGGPADPGPALTSRGTVSRGGSPTKRNVANRCQWRRASSSSATTPCATAQRCPQCRLPSQSLPDSSTPGHQPHCCCCFMMAACFVAPHYRGRGVHAKVGKAKRGDEGADDLADQGHLQHPNACSSWLSACCR